MQGNGVKKCIYAIMWSEKVKAGGGAGTHMFSIWARRCLKDSPVAPFGGERQATLRWWQSQGRHWRKCRRQSGTKLRQSPGANVKDVITTIPHLDSPKRNCFNLPTRKSGTKLLQSPGEKVRDEIATISQCESPGRKG